MRRVKDLRFRLDPLGAWPLTLLLVSTLRSAEAACQACPDGWTVVGDTKCFKLASADTKTWNDVANLCAQSGAKLPSVNSDLERDTLWEVGGGVSDSSQMVWNGLTMPVGVSTNAETAAAQYTWHDGTTDFSYLLGGSLSLVFNNDADTCVRAVSAAHIWWDISCTSSFKGVCQLFQEKCTTTTTDSPTTTSTPEPTTTSTPEPTTTSTPEPTTTSTQEPTTTSSTPEPTTTTPAPPEPCRPGTYANWTSGSFDCLDCGVGSYSTITQAPNCTACAPGKYGNGTRGSSESFCVSCPPNSFGPEGAGDLANCSCNAGYSGVAGAAGADGGGCVACAAGTYKSLAGSSGCQACAVGKYSNATGAVVSTTCLECPVFSNSTTAGFLERWYNYLASEESSSSMPAVDDGRKPFLVRWVSQINYTTDSDFGAVFDQEGVSSSVSNLDYFAIVWTGGFEVVTGGDYEFFTNSDDGSNVWIDGVHVVDNSGTHPARVRSGSISLTSGFHVVKVDFHEKTGYATMETTYRGPDTSNEAAFLSGNWNGAGANSVSQCICVTGYSGPDGGSCSACPTGTYKGILGSASCTQCRSGTYGNSTGGESCRACPGNTSSVEGGTSCTCVNSYYGPPHGPCELCPAGSWCQNSTQYQCPANSTASQGSDSSSDCVCEPGSFGVNGGVCSVCPANKYCPGGNSVLGCPESSESLAGSSSIESCKCSAGFYRNATGGCSVCESGFWCFEESKNPCPLNSNSTPSSSRADECVCIGGYLGANGENCTVCPEDSWCSLGSSIKCANQSTSSSGSSAVTQCICRPGYTGSHDSSCSVCEAGTYKGSNGTQECSYCQSGKFSTEMAAKSETSCRTCPLHSHSVLIPAEFHYVGFVNWNMDCSSQTFVQMDNAMHTACGNAYGSSVIAVSEELWFSGKIKTEEADPASFHRTKFTVFTDSVASASCPPTGTDAACTATGGEIRRCFRPYLDLPTQCDDTATTCYAATTRYAMCVRVVGDLSRPNGFPLSTITNCTCNMGYSGADGANCTACSAGSYKAINGSSPCMMCSAGTYSTGRAERTCQECPSFTNSEVGSSSLSSCTCYKGYSGPDGTACQACAAGTFKPSTGSAACTICSSGQYSTAIASDSACLDCPASTTSNPGSSALAACQCPEGYSGPNGGDCLPCGPGTFKVGLGSALCTSCPAGTYSSESAAPLLDNCTACAPNSVSLEGSTSASQCHCKPGFSNADGGSCSACPAGTFKSENGSSSCILCQGGRYSTDIGSNLESNCMTCPQNSNSNAGSSHIENCTCLPGFQGRAGGSCSICGPGTFKQEDQCSTCPPNTWSPGQTDECISCPLNSISPSGSASNVSCVCPAGYTGDDGYDCTPCPFGQFKSVEGSSQCLNCVEGKYGFAQALTTSSECQDCPSNTNSPAGSTEADQCICKVGYSPGVIGCDACPQGSYKAINGSTPCLSCAPNTYGTGTAATTSVQCAACPASTVSSVGSSHPDNCTCVAGFGSLSSGECEACSAGTYKNHSANLGCSPCEAGSFSSQQAATSCDICATGLTSAVGQPGCVPIATNTTPAPPPEVVANITNNTVVAQAQELGQALSTVAAVAVSTNVAVSVAASVVTSVGASVGAAASGSVASSSAASAGSSGGTMTVVNQVQFLAILGGAGESDAASAYSDSFGWAMMDTPVDLGGGESKSATARRRQHLVNKIRRSSLLYKLIGRRKKTTGGLGQDAEDFQFDGQCDDVGNVLLEKLMAAGILLVIVFIFRNLVWFLILVYTGHHSNELVFPAWEGPVTIFEFFPIAEIAAATFGQFCTGWSVISVVLFLLGPGTLLVLSYYLVSKYMKKGKLNFEYHVSFDQRLKEIEEEEESKGKKRSGIRTWFHRFHVRYMKFTNGGGWDITHKEARFWAFTFGDFRDTVFLFFAWQLAMKLLVSISMHILTGPMSAGCLCILYGSDMVIYIRTWPFVDGLNNIGSAICGITNFLSVVALSLPRIFPSVDWYSIIPEFLIVMIATLGMFATLLISTVKPVFGAASALARLPCWGAIFACFGSHAFLSAAGHAGREGGAQFLLGVAAEEAEDQMHEKAHGRGIGEDDPKHGEHGDDDYGFDVGDTPGTAVLVFGPNYIPFDPKNRKRFTVAAELAYSDSTETSSNGSTKGPSSKVHQLPRDLTFQKVHVSSEQKANPRTVKHFWEGSVAPPTAKHSIDEEDSLVNSKSNLAQLFVAPRVEDPVIKMRHAIDEAVQHVHERQKRRWAEHTDSSILEEPAVCTVRLNIADPIARTTSDWRSAIGRAKSAASFKRGASSATRIKRGPSSSTESFKRGTSSAGKGKTTSKKSLASKLFSGTFKRFDRTRSKATDMAQDDDSVAGPSQTMERKDVILNILQEALNDQDWLLRLDQIAVEQEDQDQFLVTFTNTDDIGPDSISANKLAETTVQQSWNKQSRLSKKMSPAFTLVSAVRVSNDGTDLTQIAALGADPSRTKRQKIPDSMDHLARLASGAKQLDRVGSSDHGQKYCYTVEVGVKVKDASLESLKSRKHALAETGTQSAQNELTELQATDPEGLPSDPQVSKGPALFATIRKALSTVDTIPRLDQISFDATDPERCLLLIRDTFDTGPNIASAKDLVNNFLELCDNDASRFVKLLRSTPFKLVFAKLIDRKPMPMKNGALSSQFGEAVAGVGADQGAVMLGSVTGISSTATSSTESTSGTNSKMRGMASHKKATGVTFQVEETAEMLRDNFLGQEPLQHDRMDLMPDADSDWVPIRAPSALEASGDRRSNDLVFREPKAAISSVSNPNQSSQVPDMGGVTDHVQRAVVHQVPQGISFALEPHKSTMKSPRGREEANLQSSNGAPGISVMPQPHKHRSTGSRSAMRSVSLVTAKGTKRPSRSHTYNLPGASTITVEPEGRISSSLGFLQTVTSENKVPLLNRDYNASTRDSDGTISIRATGDQPVNPFGRNPQLFSVQLP